MSKYSKWNGKIIELGLPIGTAILILGVNQFYKEYPWHLVLGAISLVLIIMLIYMVFRFLDKREERWIRNRGYHSHHQDAILDLRSKLEKQDSAIGLLKQEISINNKINKLESRISYLEGERNARQRK